MKKRILAVVLCCSLDLGAVAYEPPKAKAVAVADDMLVASLIYSVMAAGGYQFTATNINTPTLADALAPYLAKFNKKVGQLNEDVWVAFVNFLGSDSIASLRNKLNVNPDPPEKKGVEFLLNAAIFEKIVEFVDWLGDELGLKEDTADDSMFGANKKAIYSISGVFVPIGGVSRPVQNADVSMTTDSSCFLFPFPSSDGDRYSLGDSAYIIVKPYSSSSTYTDWVNGKASYDVTIYDSSDSKITTYNSGGGRLVGFGYSLTSDLFYWILDYNGQTISGNPGGKWQRNSVHKNSLSRSLRWEDILGYSLHETYPEPISSGLATKLPDEFSPTVPDDSSEDVPLLFPDLSPDLDLDGLLEKILENLRDNTLKVEPSTATDPDPTPDPNPNPEPGADAGILDWIKSIFQAILNLPDLIAQAFQKLFAPDTALVSEISDAFQNKFGFLPAIYALGTDLFGMTAETEPPVIWIHLEKAEGVYTYGGAVKALDLSWYQRYKADVDKLISGFMWLAFLWLLFKRASGIIQGAEMVSDYDTAISRGYRESNATKVKNWRDK